MLINKDIGNTDKIILNRLGKDADTSITDLLTSTRYRRKSSVYNRIRHLRSEKYLFGPYFDVNYNAIGTNKLYSVFVFAHYDPLYRAAVLEAMKRINCWTMIYPVRTAEAYLGIYRCNNWNYIATLMGLMDRWGWLKEYSVHKSEHRWILSNPDFFGAFMPASDYQIPTKEELPHFRYETIDPNIEYTQIDLTVLKYLSRKTCRLTEMRNLEYRYHGIRLKYHDLKRSFDRLKNSNVLLEKNFIILPLPLDMSSLFFLITHGRNFRSHLETVAGFGEGLRLHKTLIVVGREIISYFLAHPLLEGKILGIIEDNMDNAKLYGIKTYPSHELAIQSLNDNYFDVENQRWVFPYSGFREELKKIKEKRGD